MLSENNSKLRKIIAVIGHYQTLMIVAELLIVKQICFNELRKKIGVNPASMDKYLKLLVDENIVKKDETAEVMRNWYSLTQKGLKLGKVITILKKL